MGSSCGLRFKQEIDTSWLDETLFEKKIQDTIKEWKLFDKNSKVLVACSGGKDSTVILYVLHKLGYKVEAITVDAQIGCYTVENLKNLQKVCDGLDVKLHIVSFRKEFGKSLCYIQSVLKDKGINYKSCHTCGVLRRKLLNQYAKKIGPDVLVTGHNQDDEAQVIMMNLLRGNLDVNARMGPKSGLKADAKFISRVKPMYFISEKEVIAYSQKKNFPVHYGECPCSSESYRRNLKEIFLDLEKEYPNLKTNIIKSFISLKPSLMEYFGREAIVINDCVVCGEPTSSDVCSPCRILGLLD